MPEGFLHRVLHVVPLPRPVRRLWRRVNPRRNRLPRILVNGFPKSGTHLLQRCMELLPGLWWDSKWLHWELQHPISELDVPVEVIEGGDWPPAVEAAGRVLASIGPGEFLMAHLRHFSGFVRLLERRRFRSVLILRDPRDVVVSLAFHFVCVGTHDMNDYFTRVLRTDDERFMACIRGVKPSPETGGKGTGGIRERLAAFLPWQQVPFNYITRFERLVGPQGGGDAEIQRAEIEAIARHLGVHPTAEQLDNVVENLYGQSVTFRRGRIGSWKEHFIEAHKAAFKEAAGQYLIELGYEKDDDW